MHVLVIILLFVAVLLVIFTLQNSMEISINLFFWEISNAPLVLVLISCILLGYLIALIYFYPRMWKLKRVNSQLQRFKDELDGINGKQEPKADELIAQEPTDPEGVEMGNMDDNTFFKD